MILETILSLASLAWNRCRSFCGASPSSSPSSQDAEQSPLIDHSASSLTGEFEDFAHSLGAWRVCLFHAAIYYAAAVLGFSFLVERWSIIDSLYLATVIFTTIGYGDLEPTTEAGRFYVIGLAAYGILILGIFLGIAGTLSANSWASYRIPKQHQQFFFSPSTVLSR
jgi:hypothetical protein